MKLLVIVVCFNNLEGLKRTLRSIESQQSSTDIHCVIIDAKSIDGTSEFLFSNYKNRTNFKYISEKDAGIYDGMNKGMQHVSHFHDYFIFLNSGDEFSDCKSVDRVLSPLKSSRSKPGLIFGSYYSVNGSTKIRRSAREATFVKFGMPTSHQAIFYAGRLAASLRFDLRYKLSGDYDHLIRCINYCKEHSLQVISKDEDVSVFHLDGVSQIKRRQALSEDFRIRRFDLGLSFSSCAALYVLHFVHHQFKSLIGKITHATKPDAPTLHPK